MTAHREPLIHSRITDGLPEDHPLAQQGVYCAQCGNMLHAFNNECMQIWVETGIGNFCLRCFAAKDKVLVVNWALPPHETLDKLRRCFDQRLIAEVNRHGGIPYLEPEEMALREAIAELLEDDHP